MGPYSSKLHLFLKGFLKVPLVCGNDIWLGVIWLRGGEEKIEDSVKFIYDWKRERRAEGRGGE